MDRAPVDKALYFRQLLSLHRFYSDSISAMEMAVDSVKKEGIEEVHWLLRLVREKGRRMSDSLVCTLAGGRGLLSGFKGDQEQLKSSNDCSLEKPLRKRRPVSPGDWPDLQEISKRKLIHSKSRQPFILKESCIHNQQKHPYTSQKENTRDTSVNASEYSSKADPPSEKLSNRSALLPLVGSDNIRIALLEDQNEYKYGDPLSQVIPSLGIQLHTNHNSVFFSKPDDPQFPSENWLKDDFEDIFERDAGWKLEDSPEQKLSFDLEVPLSSSICSFDPPEFNRLTSIGNTLKDDPLYCSEDWPVNTKQSDRKENSPIECFKTMVRTNRGWPLKKLDAKTMGQREDSSKLLIETVVDSENKINDTIFENIFLSMNKKNGLFMDRKKGGGRKTSYPKMEKSILAWVLDTVSKTCKLPSRREIRNKALDYCDPDHSFKASKGWCDKFLTRNKNAFNKAQKESRR